jgi:uncharacterized protein YbjT (DUF2867 family)
MSRICIVGGTGFIGRHVAEILTGQQHVLIVPTRRRERAKNNLITLPTVDVIQANRLDEETLERLLARCDAVINLAGVLHSKSGYPYGPAFAESHVELPKRIIAACRRQGVRRLVHVGALGAAPDAPSEYLRSKGDGESAVLESGPDVTVFQPSVVFGQDDSFLNLFAWLNRRFPFIALGMGQARMQPVYVEDVAGAIARSVFDEDSYGRVYPLVGPKVYSLAELVRYAGELSGAPRPILALGKGLAMLQARLLEWLPGKLMSRDNLRSLQVDSVSSAPLPFGITATRLEAIAPSYLSGTWPRTRYDRFRRGAGRVA